METKTINGYHAVKIFSATKALDRDRLGDRITEWLISYPQLEVVDTITKQSSDNAFHCLTIILFLRPIARAAEARAA